MTASKQSAFVPILITLLLGAPWTAAAADPFRELDLVRPSRSTAATDFIVPGLGGSPLSLKRFAGHVVLLNFWATWCPPCKEEMPSLERLYRRYKDRRFSVLALSLDADGAASVAPFVRKFGLTFPVGLDSGLAVANQYTVRGLPTTFLIDRGGAVAAFALGPRAWDGAAAHAVIDALLK